MQAQRPAKFSSPSKFRHERCHEPEGTGPAGRLPLALDMAHRDADPCQPVKSLFTKTAAWPGPQRAQRSGLAGQSPLRHQAHCQCPALKRLGGAAAPHTPPLSPQRRRQAPVASAGPPALQHLPRAEPGPPAGPETPAPRAEVRQASRGPPPRFSARRAAGWEQPGRVPGAQPRAPRSAATRARRSSHTESPGGAPPLDRHPAARRGASARPDRQPLAPQQNAQRGGSLPPLWARGCASAAATATRRPSPA